MNTQNSTLAARFFFRNCAVSLHLPGEIRISRTLTPGSDDIILDRDFTPAGTPTDFIGSQSDFYRFLDATSSTNASLIKKLTAIGYLLCNKLPRGRCRCQAFICANEEKGACANGKTLFTRAIAQFCRTSFAAKYNARSPFWLDVVDESTNLLVLDHMPIHFDYKKIFNLSADDWIVRRKAQEALVIPREVIPYLLITTSASVKMIRQDCAFRRRFVVLDFSSVFGPQFPIDQNIGFMFDQWGSDQWHIFDNFMFYCVLEYLRSYSRDEDVFRLYR